MLAGGLSCILSSVIIVLPDQSGARSIYRSYGKEWFLAVFNHPPRDGVEFEIVLHRLYAVVYSKQPKTSKLLIDLHARMIGVAYT